MAEKPPIVLLPGMMCDARLFQPQRAALGDRFEVIVPNFGTETTIAAMRRCC